MPVSSIANESSDMTDLGTIYIADGIHARSIECNENEQEKDTKAVTDTVGGTAVGGNHSGFA